MALFDALIADIASRFGLGASAAPLVREGVALIAGGQGGVAGFLDLMRKAGLSSQVASWLGRPDAAALGEQDLERAVGPGAIGRVADGLGLGRSVATAAMAYCLPKLIGLLTPQGVVPSTLPTEAAAFLAPPAAQVAPSQIRIHKATAAEPAQVAPNRVDVLKAGPAAPAAKRMPWWLWPAAAVVLLLVGWRLWPAAEPMKTETVTAQATAPAPVAETPAPAPKPVAQPQPATPAAPAPAMAATLLAWLTLDDANGVFRYAGTVHDDQAKASILDALKTAFGADNIKGALAVNPRRASAPWIDNLRHALDSLKVPGVEAAFQGGSVSVGGAIADADRQKIVASLRSALGQTLTVESLTDRLSADATSANAKAISALAGLSGSFGGRDVAAVLNQSVMNFATGSAEVPSSALDFLSSGAAALKKLPSGAVLEIAGYTDNTGDPDANIQLSQRRADAVRQALIKDGVPTDMLVAKGYGAANPIASNDDPDGRLRNRRIEYRLVKSS